MSLDQIIQDQVDETGCTVIRVTIYQPEMPSANVNTIIRPDELRHVDGSFFEFKVNKAARMLRDLVFDTMAMSRIRGDG